MELLDRKVNDMFSKTDTESNFEFFSDFSDFSNKTINKIIYYIEIIKDNIDNIYEETKMISGFIFTSAGKYPLEDINITSKYGERINPITYKSEIHKGIDIASPEGTDIYSLWPGTVSEIGGDDIYGNFIVIEHSYGFYTKYCHLSKILVKINDFINAGNTIGETGSTGYSTGSHLHLEVIVEGVKIDPMECFEF